MKHTLCYSVLSIGVLLRVILGAAVPPGYLLGAGDVLEIRSPEADEITTKAIRVSSNSTISLPMVGVVSVSGLTSEGLAAELSQRISIYVRHPEVAVNVLEMRSQPVSVVGAVRNPGIYQIENKKTLVQMIGLAGGLKDDAGDTLRLIRRKDRGIIPLAGTVLDKSGDFSTAELPVHDLIDGKISAATLIVLPEDVLSVSQTELVYVLGEVKKPGAYAASNKSKLSVLEALSRAEGVTRTASLNKARIMRLTGTGGNREEIPLNLEKILRGKLQDVPLLPNDILLVPDSPGKNALMRSAETILQVGATALVYRP